MKRFGTVEDPSDWDGQLVTDKKVRRKPCSKRYLNYLYIVAAVIVTYCIFWYYSNQNVIDYGDTIRPTMSPTPSPTIMVDEINLPLIDPQCITKLPYNPDERHIVDPPHGEVTLVCCKSTKGVFNVAVHLAWAPLGAARFLDMVESNFFSSEVPLFRSLKAFLIQFGLAGNPEVQEPFDNKGNLPDDPQWLPCCPPGREINGTSRFQKGYLAYAGAGKNSRGTQLIMTFENNKYLGGGSPWEVPFGQLVGETSFRTLSQIYTGYGEKVSQGKIRNRGNAYTKEEFPLLDYITECKVVKEHEKWYYTHKHGP